MKRTLAKYLFLLFLIGLSGSAFSQAEDISQYLDDDGISTSKNLFTINLVSPLTGDFAGYYERVLFKRLTLEVGAGVVGPFYLFEWPSLKGKYDMNLGGLGYSFHLAPKLYFNDAAPEYSYIGPSWRMRHYVPENGPGLTVHDFTWNYGYHLFTRGNLMFGANIGSGVRFVSTEENGEKVFQIVDGVYPFNLRFGFRF